ncbi:MAG: alpha/beta hydrolase [Xanthomonadaceae bacterium]|nr:alpha/beta hydrolase [Xanthomonadaceae bacterium]
MNWLLMRGLIREQRHWEHFPSIFAQQLPDSKVFFLDMPGMGTEMDRSSPQNIPEIVEDLRSRFQVLREKNPGPWKVMALSFGGMVLLEWTRKYPDDFKTLVLINSSLSNLSPFYDRMQLPTAVKFLPLFISDNKQMRERTLLERTTSGRTPTADIERRWTEIAMPKNKLIPVALAQIKAAMKYKLHEKPKTPVVVLTSKMDQLASSRCSERISKFLEAPIRFHDWAGHDLTLEDPLWVCERVKELA